MGTLASILFFIGITCIFVFMIWVIFILPISVDLYFMSFKLEKHPKILEMLEDVAYTICREEGIGIFHEDYKVMNVDREKGDEALGLYTYTTNREYLESLNATRMRIEVLESQYDKPYEEVCKIVGFESNKKKSDFVLPRITLCNSLRDLGLTNYFSTFYHEIGHHFAVKKMGGNHNEKDADIYARNIMMERLPLFVQLIYTFHYNYRLNEKVLKGKKKVVAYVDYLKYLLTGKVSYGSPGN